MNPDSRPKRGGSRYKTRLLSAALCFLAALHCALLPLRLSAPVSMWDRGIAVIRRELGVAAEARDFQGIQRAIRHESIANALIASPGTRHVGPVDSADAAIRQAKALWAEDYRAFDVTEGCVIEARYCTRFDGWYVYGTVEGPVLACVPCALIGRKGDVRAVWIG